MHMLVSVVAYLVQFLAFAVFARSIISWLPIDKDGSIVHALAAITDPILEPLRRVIPSIGMIDLSPMVAMLGLFFLANVLKALDA